MLRSASEFIFFSLWRLHDVPRSSSCLCLLKKKVYAKAVVTNGCCGHLELLKLWAWSLTEYDWVRDDTLEMHTRKHSRHV